MYLRQIPRLDGVKKCLLLWFAFKTAMHNRPRLLKHRPIHDQVVPLVIAAGARHLRLLLERGHRARKPPPFRDQIRQDGRLQTRLLSVRERHLA